ncbi:MAG: sigma-70 family RNA polymerase sigma factor [Dokdonella sp.]|nr:sigma-70 family RNA polymerase sigma factor [Dokdonella sp.]
MTASQLTNTTQLIRGYRDGDLAARDRLFERYLPILRRWAHGRLPAHGRDLAETDDLVQASFLRALGRLEEFEPERPGAFLAYLRTILMNQVREEIRRRGVRAQTSSLLDSLPSPQASLVEQMIGQQTLQTYEQALARLPETKRLAVMMRVEFAMSYEEIASELELPSANATRMMIVRALDELAQALGT